MKRVLFLSANPKETTRLAIDVEMRDVRQALERGQYGERIELLLEPAVRIGGLQHLLDVHKPDIVHFSGHGGEHGEEIILLDENDHACSADVEILAQILADCDGVVLNACSSARQAEAIAAHGPWAIGTSAPITDKEARVFSRTIYGKLADGCDLETAFRGAALQVGLEGRRGSEALPQLFPGSRAPRPTLVYPLTNALVQLWVTCAREKVSVQTFHKLLVVQRIAPSYFQAVFDQVQSDVASKVSQWLRRQADKHLQERVEHVPSSFDDDPALGAAQELATTRGDAHVDARTYLLALLADPGSSTIHAIRTQMDKLAPNGFARLQQAAKDCTPETYLLRSAVSGLNL